MRSTNFFAVVLAARTTVGTAAHGAERYFRIRIRSDARWTPYSIVGSGLGALLVLGFAIPCRELRPLQDAEVVTAALAEFRGRQAVGISARLARATGGWPPGRLGVEFCPGDKTNELVPDTRGPAPGDENSEIRRQQCSVSFHLPVVHRTRASSGSCRTGSLIHERKR